MIQRGCAIYFVDFYALHRLEPGNAPCYNK